MKYNVICPICRTQISKSGNGTNSEQVCPKCKAELLVEVMNSQVKVAILKDSPKHKTPKQKKSA